jgi:hypothetical protein
MVKEKVYAFLVDYQNCNYLLKKNKVSTYNVKNRIILCAKMLLVFQLFEYESKMLLFKFF